MLLYLAIYLKFKHCVSVVAFHLEVDAEGAKCTYLITRMGSAYVLCSAISLTNLYGLCCKDLTFMIHDQRERGGPLTSIVVAALLMQIAKVVVFSHQQKSLFPILMCAHNSSISVPFTL